MRKLTNTVISLTSLLSMTISLAVDVNRAADAAPTKAKQNKDADSKKPTKAKKGSDTKTSTDLASDVVAGNDILMKAMSDELQRSMDNLKLDGHRSPYFLSYMIRDTTFFKASASFGGLTDEDFNRRRLLSAYVRVGDYKVDSSINNVAPGQDILNMMRRQSRNGSLPVDDDYVALRHKLWLRTDSSYKEALKDLESNQRYLRDNNVTDRPDSFSKEDPVVFMESPAVLTVDKDHWTETLKKSSGVFREFDKVLRSNISIGGQAETKRYINNEGFKNRVGETSYSILLDAVAQAPDGMILADQEYMPSYKESDLPSEEQLSAKARELGQRLTDLAAAPLVDDYRGPVLFEGQAAGQFVHEVLDSKLCAIRSTPQQQSFGENSERIGSHITPPFISIVDDPTAKEFKGTPLFGNYIIDDDGVKGQKITLVEKGILKTLCSSRNPTKQISKSNGHSRYGNGATSNLFITSTKQFSHAELKQRLIDLGKEQGLDEVYIIKRIILNPTDLGAAGFRNLLRAFVPGGNGIYLFPPVLMYRVSVADGKETLVRGGQFNNISMRAVRDIESTGDDDAAYIVQKGEELLSVVTPSLLVREIEIEKPERANSKRPILSNPYFETK